MTEETMRELMDRREAADALRISTRTLARLDKACLGPPKILLTERRVAYRRVDVLTWIDTRPPARQLEGCKAAP